jgi:addiction module RelE/StbE family toxin
MKLVFTDSAQRDLSRLREFIAKHNPHAAARIAQRLITTVRSLPEQPKIGVTVAELPGVRELVSGDYIVRYMQLETNIIILRIWHEKEQR